jgi:hypothetical protein
MARAMAEGKWECSHMTTHRIGPSLMLCPVAVAGDIRQSDGPGH